MRARVARPDIPILAIMGMISGATPPGSRHQISPDAARARTVVTHLTLFTIAANPHYKSRPSSSFSHPDFCHISG
jgi:hypothetical protein